MSEIENNNSIVPVPDEKKQQVQQTTNHDVTESKKQDTFVQTVIEKYEKKTAGFWIRFFAFVVDSLVAGAIVGILVNPIFYLMDWSFDESKWYAPMAIFSAIFYYAYFIITTKLWQQTLGKMIFGLKVVSIKDEKLTWLTVIFRELVGRFISNTISILYIMVAFMPKNQGLQDIIADTVVIHEKIYVKNKQTVLTKRNDDTDVDTDQTVTQTI